MSQLFIPSSPDGSEPIGGSSQNSPSRFQASTTHVSHLADILSTITQINHQALMIVSETGIAFYAEHNHITNVQLTIDSSLFSTFNLEFPSRLDSQSEPRDMRIGVDVSLIGDSFMAASSTAANKTKNPTTSITSGSDSVVCFIKYEGEGHPLVIEFEDRLMSEKIEFATFYTDFEYPYDQPLYEESNALLVDHDSVESEIIVKSDILANLLSDLQHVGTEDLFIYASNCDRMSTKTQNQLNFISRGAIGYSKLIFPSTKTMLEKLQIFKKVENEMTPCEGSILTCVSFQIFVKVFRAVKISSKCKIMKDNAGTLSLQLLCKNTAASNYSGSLITFNILEKSSNNDQFDRPVQFDVNDIFDDELYHHIKEYDNSENNVFNTSAPHHVVPVKEPALTENLSYSSFQNPKSKISDEGHVQQKRQKRSNNEGEDDEERDVSISGAVEIPIFL